MNITTFSDLSSEIIIYIFDFLSPVDRYQAFFDCNFRFRSLVKRWTEYSRKGLDADILRFSTLHSWYKHLDFENGGSLYFTWPQKGQQLRYSFDPCVTDDIGLHWHFISSRNIEIINDEKVCEIITRHPFRLNPFFYHDETRYSASDNESSIIRAFYGSDIILSRYRSSLKPWLENNYPDSVEKILDSKDSNIVYNNAYDQKLVPIFDGEWSKAMNSIHEAAKRVWNDLKELDDVNPLNLQRKE